MRANRDLPDNTPARATCSASLPEAKMTQDTKTRSTVSKANINVSRSTAAAAHCPDSCSLDDAPVEANVAFVGLSKPLGGSFRDEHCSTPSTDAARSARDATPGATTAVVTAAVVVVTTAVVVSSTTGTNAGRSGGRGADA